MLPAYFPTIKVPSLTSVDPTNMQTKLLLHSLTCVFLTFGMSAVRGADAPHPKNWTPPPHKIYAQKLADEIMASHPELISVTFHGVPPGQADAYTMFAGSFPDRIGNADDPDDIDISKKGITIGDPRWHRPNDAGRFDEADFDLCRFV